MLSKSPISFSTGSTQSDQLGLVNAEKIENTGNTNCPGADRSSV